MCRHYIEHISHAGATNTFNQKYSSHADTPHIYRLENSAHEKYAPLHFMGSVRLHFIGTVRLLLCTQVEYISSCLYKVYTSISLAKKYVYRNMFGVFRDIRLIAQLVSPASLLVKFCRFNSSLRLTAVWYTPQQGVLAVANLSEKFQQLI